MMRLLTPVAVLLVAALPCGAAAEEAASVELRVEATELREVVQLVIANESASRADMYLDVRLATVELLAESGRRLSRCAAPRGAVTSGQDHRRFVTLEPGEHTSELLDLRYLCFGRRLRHLAEAARARITYSARSSHDPMGRQLVSVPIGPVEVVLPPRDEGGSESPADGEGGEPGLRLRHLGAHPDLPEGTHVPVLVELRAPSRASMPVVVRPELFAFTVTRLYGPPINCQLPETRVRPLRDFFERLGRRRISLDLARLCPAGELDHAGVYVVTPVFTAHHDGHDVGLHAWTGTAEGEPFLVRVRRASRQQEEPVEIEVPGVAQPRTEGGDAP